MQIDILYVDQKSLGLLSLCIMSCYVDLWYMLANATCQHCDQTLTLEHMLLECTVLQHSRNEYYTADSLRTLFETVPEACIVEFLREAGFFYLIWMAIYPEQLLI